MTRWFGYSNYTFGLNIYNDLVYTVIDHSAVPSWNYLYQPMTQRCLAPLNLIIRGWSGRRSGTTAEKNKWGSIWHPQYYCGHNQLGCLKDVRNYFAEPIYDLQGLFKETANEARNFNGARLQIYTMVSWFDWKIWKLMLQVKPYKIQSGGLIAKAQLFGLLSAAHNFTFDTRRPNKSVPRETECLAGSISTASAFYEFAASPDCHLSPLAFNMFVEYKLYYTSELSLPYPLTLSALALPLDLSVVLSLSISYIIILIVMQFKVKRRCVADSLLVLLSATLNQSLSSFLVQKLRWWYSFWLFLTVFITISYTNVLQSIVVVPGVYQSYLTFSDMVRLNYTFRTYDTEWLRAINSVTKEYIENNENGRSKTALQSKHLMEKWIVEHGEDFQILPMSPEAAEYFTRDKQALLYGLDVLSWLRGYMKATGLQFYEGTEQIFDIPLYWSFGDLYAANFVAETLERVKNAGFYSYLTHSADSEFASYIEKMVRTGAQGIVCGRSAACVGLDNDHVTSRVPLTDSLMQEAFVLLLYGISFAILVITAESWHKNAISNGLTSLKKKVIHEPHEVSY